MQRSRSVSSDRRSLVPLRVRNDDNIEPSSTARSSRNSMRKSSIQSSNGRSLSGNRMSVGSRQSMSGRPSVSGAGSRPSIGGSRNSVSQFARPNQLQTKRLSRGSGMGVRNNGIPKDPRPVSDKGFQHKCIKNIFQFLSDKGYPHNITAKALQSPTNKDFFRIFEFIYGLIVPDYKISSKPEEDIPKIFKTLGYPFMMSKSAMFAVGSPHMWPSILAALSWLVDLIEYGMNMSSQVNNILFPPEENSFDTISERQISHCHMVRSYGKFLDGCDDYTEEDCTLRDSLKKRLSGSAGGYDEMLEENRILKMQLDQLEQDKDRIKTEKQKLQLLKLDEERLRGFLSELDGHKRQQDQQAKETEERWNELKTELEAENAKYLKMQLIYEKQEFSQEDVERLKKKERELIQRREDIDRNIQALDQEVWQKEMAVSKNTEQIDVKCQAYNTLAYNLKLIPVSAENSSGIDYELKKMSFSDKEAQNFANIIKPALNVLKRQCQDSCMSRESDKMAVTERLEELTETLSDMNNEVALIENKNKRAEMELENKKQMYQTEREEIQHSIEELENEKLMWNSGAMYSSQDFEKEKKKIDKWAAMESEKRLQRLRDYNHFFERAMTVYMEHVDKIQTSVSNSKKISDTLLEKTQQQAKQMGIE